MNAQTNRKLVIREQTVDDPVSGLLFRFEFVAEAKIRPGFYFGRRMSQLARVCIPRARRVWWSNLKSCVRTRTSANIATSQIGLSGYPAVLRGNRPNVFA